MKKYIRIGVDLGKAIFRFTRWRTKRAWRSIARLAEASSLRSFRGFRRAGSGWRPAARRIIGRARSQGWDTSRGAGQQAGQNMLGDPVDRRMLPRGDIRESLARAQ
jgi:hypothetical protein